MGLYSDNGLFILCKINKQLTDTVRKKIISIFKSIDFKTEIVTNLTEVDFLDVHSTQRTTHTVCIKNPMTN